jgi:predicted ribosome quality control (RQC) complex YloA/Tae2 family protein
MPLDALTLYAAAEELRRVLIDMKVDKVQQPEKDVFLLSLRGSSPLGGGQSLRLLISAGAGSARVHLTDISRENPASPPMLCMLLRKHLSGARIKDISQPEGERLYDIVFSAFDDFGSPVEKRLVVEMMGRNSNLILIDAEGRVLDCLRKMGADITAEDKRILLPGLFYSYPPRPDRPYIFSLGESEFEALYTAAVKDTQADRWLVSEFSGLSPLLAREAVYRVSGYVDTHIGRLDGGLLYRELKQMSTEGFTPCMLKNGEKPFELSCLPLTQYGKALELVRYESFSKLFDSFYTERERLDRLAQRSQSILKTVKNRRDRAAKKLLLRTQELRATRDRERLRQLGDLIKANIYRMSKGQTKLSVEDFYSENSEMVDITLEAKLSPQQNAEKYYKAYNKAKNAEKILHGQIEEAETELNYLESVLEELSRVSGEKDLEEIRQELIEEGFLKDSGGSGRKKKPPSSQPLKFVSSAGAEILVGRNNLQNERLTLKFAQKNDIWLHTQKIHGSHVIAFCSEEDRTTLLEAAMLAAYYSKARDGSNVPVDYTRVKNVKKPQGAKTGMVIYTDYKTLYVTPDEAEVKKLMK